MNNGADSINLNVGPRERAITGEPYRYEIDMHEGTGLKPSFVYLTPEELKLWTGDKFTITPMFRAAPITGEPVVWRYMMPGGVYHYTAYHDPEDPDCLTGEPLYRAAPITGETSRDVAAEGGSPAPVQSTRNTPSATSDASGQ